ncbi:YncE family protein [Pseudofrankia sp. BMG5.37]|uniref:YncE family protein n=1 Tax=Pseudofrankia sp. BMG5.37 TaxID=3050035 RepID=UPI002893A8A4|nr:YncE family protein [Pseudofrankia sp. BMG5.37]MDT3439613.1 YncE family protein [Pseudofrankia sp. BMG5.37]
MFALAMATLVAAAASGCSSDGEAGAATVTHAAGTSGMGTMTMPAGTTMPPASTLASTPATGAGGRGVYAHTGAGDLSPKVAGQRSLVYVPNSDGDSVTVIDPKTFKVIDEFTTGAKPQHVVPSWDLSTLYATNNTGNSLTPIDPVTGRVKGSNIPVADPYNMYFTPDGTYAIVVAEAQQRLDFYDARTWKLHRQLPVTCPGVDHIDYSADESYLIATCEFSGKLVKVDWKNQEVLGYLTIGGMPQDIKLDPQGEVFYVADMDQNGVHLIDGESFRQIGFMPTGKGAHGLYPSRDAKVLYVSNRGEGTISLIDFATRKIVDRWEIPGGSPDMGGVSVNGDVLWLSGRYNREVYAISTKDGGLLARIPVGAGPHGLSVWPQPGRYSLGHTGILR